MTSTNRPKIPLPGNWSLTVKSAVLHATWLAQIATAYPSVLAMFGVRRVRIGWPATTSQNVRDVASRFCQLRKGVVVERLDRFDRDEVAWL